MSLIPPLDASGRFASQSWQCQANHNFNSLVDYINWLFQKHSRLLVIRLDLSFRVNAQGRYDAEYARACFQRMLNNRRFNQIFEHLLGYIWSMEYGQDCGFHYHCIFCFDGHERMKDTFIGHQIGSYWRDVITDRTGFYHCSNDDISRLHERGFPVGIGMVRRTDQEKRENMLRMATYLLKDSDSNAPLLQTMLPENVQRFRTFGRGEIRN